MLQSCPEIFYGQSPGSVGATSVIKPLGSALQPVTLASAHHSLIASVGHLPGNSAGLTSHSRSASASRHLTSATDFRDAGCAYTLHPYGIIRLLRSFDLPVVLTRSSVARSSKSSLPPQSHEPVVQRQASRPRSATCSVPSVPTPLTMVPPPPIGPRVPSAPSVRTPPWILPPSGHHGACGQLPRGAVCHQIHALHRSLCPLTA
ncbi:hypothetical protein DPX16_7094 [Anabarilius grahami]|uniref:Uncharacterized protein n=1 Tax=Anabarilius grahami TaxID=495550 RepID=A0A3N0XJA9_ANAGA|nr:hypothetical protein DPX16_7094 [Anabarilius grahami]